jgi:hypothetical protein
MEKQFFLFEDSPFASPNELQINQKLLAMFAIIPKTELSFFGKLPATIAKQVYGFHDFWFNTHFGG